MTNCIRETIARMHRIIVSLYAAGAMAERNAVVSADGSQSSFVTTISCSSPI